MHTLYKKWKEGTVSSKIFLPSYWIVNIGHESRGVQKHHGSEYNFTKKITSLVTS